MRKSRKQTYSTYDRIIDSSLELFNREGERVITTNHIAAYMSMSPGNLYYHFRNKDEIIMQLFKRYSEELIHFLTESQAPSGKDDLLTFIGSIFDILWRYRFLFNDVNSLLTRNAELRTAHEAFMTEHVSPLIIQYLNRMQDQNIIVMSPRDMRIFMVNFWIVIKYWFVFDESMNNQADGSTRKTNCLTLDDVAAMSAKRAAEGDQVDKKKDEFDHISKKRGIRQILGMISPYITETFKKEMDAVFDELESQLAESKAKLKAS